jgi:hypothetical protein
LDHRRRPRVTLDERRRYEKFLEELQCRQSYIDNMYSAQNKTMPERNRRLHLDALRQNFPNQYNSGKWWPPVPLELLLENERRLFVVKP